MIIVNVSGTRKDIRWLIKNIKRDKRFHILDVSEIKKNEKKPQYSHVIMKMQRDKQHHTRERPVKNGNFN